MVNANLIISYFIKTIKGYVMKCMFDFNGREKVEDHTKIIWEEFREALHDRDFLYTDIKKAKHYKFLKSFDDLIGKNKGKKFITKTLHDVEEFELIRCVKLNQERDIDYERFIPKKKFINNDNRFSPKKVEWLYLSIGKREGECDNKYTQAEACSLKEMHAKEGDKIAFCSFEVDKSRRSCKIVDLTIADNNSFNDINGSLKNLYIDEMRDALLLKWGVYTYVKLLSEQIFLPLKTDNRDIMYSPFHCLAQYFISLNYRGIKYPSTVCNLGENIVLFDKRLAKPYGEITQHIV